MSENIFLYKEDIFEDENEIKRLLFEKIRNNKKIVNILEKEENIDVDDDEDLDYYYYEKHEEDDKGNFEEILEIIYWFRCYEELYEDMVKIIIYLFINILLFFNIQFDRLELNTKNFNYIYKNNNIFYNISSVKSKSSPKNIKTDKAEGNNGEPIIKKENIDQYSKEEIKNVDDKMDLKNETSQKCNIENEEEIKNNYKSDDNIEIPNDKIEEEKSSPSIENNKSPINKNNIKINYYSLERAIELFEKTINIQDKLDDDGKDINDDDFEEVIFDVYINNYDNIIIYYKLYEYYLEDNKKYEDFINKIYDINTENKKKKLKTKIMRCNNFYLCINNINKLNINKSLITSSFLTKMKTKDFNKFVEYIENLK